MMSDDQVIDIIRDDIKEIRSDVKTLLGLKNKVYGLIIGVSGIVTVLFNCFFK